MPHNPALIQETRAWFAKARNDLEVAAFEMTASPPFLEDVLLHAQQAAEKSMKGLLTWHGQVFRKTHDLEELAQASVPFIPEATLLFRKAVPLTEYAWTFRYPGDRPEPTKREAEEALGLARRLYETILKKLPSAVKPPPRGK